MESQIKSFADACKYLSEAETKPVVEGIPADQAKWITSMFEWQKILKARNQEANTGNPYWPNWSDMNEWKYRPWVEIEASEEKPAGFGFSRSLYANSNSYSGVGSRLSHISSQIVYGMMEDFPELFKTIMLE